MNKKYFIDRIYTRANYKVSYKTNYKKKTYSFFFISIRFKSISRVRLLKI